LKRRKKIPKKRKILDKKLIFSTGIIAVIVLGMVCYKVLVQNPEVKFSLRAAIIDQLGFGNTQNPEFNRTTTNLLIDAGFDVFYHKSEDITVNFYRGLAKYDYGIIILRVHSALRNQTPPVIDLFTSENYTDARAKELERERWLGLVTKGNYSWAPDQFYFAITPLFIESLEGYFPKSIVVAMGCWSLKPECEQLAAAFIKKGAKAYIGWNDTVYQQDTDNETVNMLNKLLNDDDKKLGDATSETKVYPIPGGTTRLDFYPESAYNLTISELIKEVKPLGTLQSTIDSQKPLPLFCVAAVINSILDHGKPDMCRKNLPQ